jgi:hypothetical protein
MSKLEPYDHPQYELNGYWNNVTGKMQFCFPISADQPGSLDTPFVSRRQDLLKELSRFTVAPLVYRSGYKSDIPTVDSQIQIPEAERNASGFSNDLVVVKTRFLSQRGDNALAVVGGSIEDIFYDQMLERVQS